MCLTEMLYRFNFYDIFLFQYFVEASRDSSIPSNLDTSMRSDYNQDDTMHLNYSTDNNTTIVDRPSMSMESQMLSDLASLTNSISCTNKFPLHKHTESHKIVHNEKPYKCSTCDKCFAGKSGFRLHQCIHTRRKPYKCSACDKCFSLKAYFNIHQRIHTGEKPYKCSTCDKCFTLKGYLKGHQRIHTGEKPYKCSMCDKCFARKSNLKLHQFIPHW